MKIFKKLPKLRGKTSLVILAVLLLLILVLSLTVRKIFLSNNLSANHPQVIETDLVFDPDGPYALLYPRNDGNALLLNIKRTASYDAITYDLTYNAEGIDRGVTGEINTSEKKGEYEQEILFGTCSKNICKYDSGVENGTLVLHIKKGNQGYRMITEWRLQRPDVVSGKLISGDNHFSFLVDPKKADLSRLKFSIINDLTGSPKLPEAKVVTGKLYSINSSVAKNLPKASVTIETAQTPDPTSKIYYFSDSDSIWKVLETKINANKLEAVADSGGIFTVLSNLKK